MSCLRHHYSQTHRLVVEIWTEQGPNNKKIWCWLVSIISDAVYLVVWAMIQNDAQTRSYLNWSANHQKRPGRTMGRQMNGLFAKSNASSSNKPHRPHLSYLSGCQWHGGVKLYYEIQGPLRREFQGARARAWGEGEVPRRVIVCFVCSFHIISLYFSWFDLCFIQFWNHLLVIIHWLVHSYTNVVIHFFWCMCTFSFCICHMHLCFWFFGGSLYFILVHLLIVFIVVYVHVLYFTLHWFFVCSFYW